MTTVQPGRYQHYRGRHYIVLGVALHSETQEELVVYRQEYGDHGLWVRPKKMFLETVEVDGQEVPRFHPLASMAESGPCAFKKGQVMADKEQLRAKCGGWRQVYSERRFGILLIILAVLLAGSPVLFGFGLSAGWFDGLTALILLAVIQSLSFERRQRMFAVLLGIPTIVICLGGHALSGTASLSALFVGHLCGVLFLFGSAGVIVKSLLNSRSLTFDSIYGAVCGYLFVGLAWAMTCLMIETFQPGSFQISQSLRTSGEQPEPCVLMYYSFVTLTTVGYGDVTPISPTTRTFAWIEAITGQFYLAIIVAGLVSMLVAKTSQPQRHVTSSEQGDPA